MIGCGGDPRTQLTDEDRQAIAEFRQYLRDRRAAEQDQLDDQPEEQQ